VKAVGILLAVIALPALGQGPPQITVDSEGKKSIVIHGDPAAAKAQLDGAARKRALEAERSELRRVENLEARSRAGLEAETKLHADRQRRILIGYECEPVDKPAYFSAAPCPKSSTVSRSFSGSTGPVFNSRGRNIGSGSYSDSVEIPIPVRQSSVYSTVGCEEGKAAHARSVTFVELDRATAFMAQYCN
jgi:hypothetical protein